jgi:hypothetical protein
MNKAQHIINNFAGNQETVAISINDSWPQPAKIDNPTQLEEYVEGHITGKTVTVKNYGKDRNKTVTGTVRVGFYTINPVNNTVIASCFDIDGSNHKQGVENTKALVAFIVEELEEINVEPTLEVSGSGKGAHAWILTNEVPADYMYNLGAYINSKIPRRLLKKKDGSFLKEVEFFPKQPWLSDNLGNMVWAPYWYKAKNKANKIIVGGEALNLDDDGYFLQKEKYQLPVFNHNRKIEDSERKVQLLKQYFINRQDALVVQDVKGNYITLKEIDGIDDFLESHINGKRIIIQKKAPKQIYSVSGHLLNDKNEVKYLAFDIDSSVNHGNGVDDPQDVSDKILDACHYRDLKAYQFVSKSGTGFHLYVFFEELQPASKARALGLEILNAVYKGEKNNIEIFPKEITLQSGGFGSSLSFPWYYGCFGSEEKCPNPIKLSKMPSYIKALKKGKKERKKKKKKSSNEFDFWSKKALASLNLALPYGNYLTGKKFNSGWLQARAIESKTGDIHPSAGVYSFNNGIYARGLYNSFIPSENASSGQSLNVFQFMVETNQAKDFKEAVKKVAEWTKTEATCPLIFNNIKLNKNKIKKEIVLTDNLNLAHPDNTPEIMLDKETEEKDVIISVGDKILSKNLINFSLFEGKNNELLVYNDNSLQLIDLSKGGSLLSKLIFSQQLIWRAVTDDGLKHCKPRYSIRYQVFELVKPHLPKLKLQLNNPGFSKERKLIAKKGYYPKDEIFQLGDFTQINPILDLEEALEIIKDAFIDFPFLPEHTGNLIACLITPYLRLMFDGPSPLFIVTFSKKEEEHNKSLVTVLISTPEPDMLLWDNVKEKIAGGSLEEIITARYIQKRILGGNTSTCFDNSVLKIMTANSPRANLDMENRIIPIFLEDPGVREQGDFDHYDLSKFVLEKKRHIQNAIIGIIQIWIEMKCPSVVNYSNNKFPLYCEIIDSILEFCNYKLMWERKIKNSLNKQLFSRTILFLKELAAHEWFEAKEVKDFEISVKSPFPIKNTRILGKKLVSLANDARILENGIKIEVEDRGKHSNRYRVILKEVAGFEEVKEKNKPQQYNKVNSDTYDGEEVKGVCSNSSEKKEDKETLPCVTHNNTQSNTNRITPESDTPIPHKALLSYGDNKEGGLELTPQKKDPESRHSQDLKESK